VSSPFIALAPAKNRSGNPAGISRRGSPPMRDVNRAAKTLRDLRIAEIVQLDMQVSDGKVQAYRAKVKLSFKFEGEG
jgi:hypothetical protein